MRTAPFAVALVLAGLAVAMLLLALRAATSGSGWEPALGWALLALGAGGGARIMFGIAAPGPKMIRRAPPRHRR